MKPITLLKKHCIFSNEFDVFVLLGVARKKDNEGITNSQEVVFREIIKDADNIEKKYTKLKTQCQNYRNIDGKKLNFGNPVNVTNLDPKVGQEIGNLIDDLNQWDTDLKGKDEQTSEQGSEQV